MDTSNLQPRLAELYALLVDGKTKQTIMAEMKITNRTFLSYCQSLFRCYGFDSFDELLANTLLADKECSPDFYMNLTDRQIKITLHVFDGNVSSKVIADSIQVNERSIAQSKFEFYKKLGINSMRELIFLLAGKEREIIGVGVS